MQSKRVARYGTWESSITPNLVAGATIGFSEPAVDGGAVYWLESRPSEGGRRALVRWTPDGGITDAVPASADIGTRVHEYGGGAYGVRGGCIVYASRADGSVWLVDGSAPARCIARVENCRYAAFVIDPARDGIFAVREDHRDRPPNAPENTIVLLSMRADTDPGQNDGRVIVRGTDFVLEPQLSPDGTRLAWIAWDQPAMPWDASQLYVASIDAGGTLRDVECIAGFGGGESIAETRWTPAGALLFTSDRTNWWNVYERDGFEDRALASAAAEFGEPHWVFGRRMIAPLDERQTLCAFIRDGIMRPGMIESGAVSELPYGPVDGAPLPYGDGAVFLATPPDAPASLRVAARRDGGASTVLRETAAFALDPADVSIGEPGRVTGAGGELAYYVFYPPRNAHVEGPPGDAPPLVVMSHGGPTSMHLPGLQIAVQWWTSRGFAVAHVNYRGSSGFGRAYRNRLNGEWGVVDVIDCIDVARALAAAGCCDSERIAIRGGSSSGMTALLAVATSDVFRATTSMFGVMELESLAAETHKFEARYTDGLVGPLPESIQRYRDRSPVNHAATIDVPVLLFQGLDDHAVPPSQATAMRDALAARGVPVTLVEFPGEGHGFRKPENIHRVLEMELAFYRDAFGLAE